MAFAEQGRQTGWEHQAASLVTSHACAWHQREGRRRPRRDLAQPPQIFAAGRRSRRRFDLPKHRDQACPRTRPSFRRYRSPETSVAAGERHGARSAAADSGRPRRGEAGCRTASEELPPRRRRRLFKSGPTVSPPKTGFWRKSLPRGIARSATRARASNCWRRGFRRQRKAPPSPPKVSSANCAWRATGCRKNSIPRPARTRGCRAPAPKRTACSPMRAPGSNIWKRRLPRRKPSAAGSSRRRQSVRQASGRNVARHHGRKALGRGAGTSARPHHRNRCRAATCCAGKRRHQRGQRPATPARRRALFAANSVRGARTLAVEACRGDQICCSGSAIASALLSSPRKRSKRSWSETRWLEAARDRAGSPNQRGRETPQSSLEDAADAALQDWAELARLLGDFVERKTAATPAARRARSAA